MGKSYTATVSVRCKKQHTCVGCGSKYSYVLVRDVKGQGSSIPTAEANAAKAAAKSAKDDVDFQPCPNCGLLQPDMVSDVQKTRLYAGTIVGVIGVVAALILGGTHVVTITNSALIAVGVTVAAFAITFVGYVYNPNRDPQGNLQAAAASGKTGLAKLDAKGSAAPSFGDGAVGLGAVGMLGLLLMGGAILTSAAAPLSAMMNGWIRNATCYPEVVGSGDAATFYFDDKLSSIKGMWDGDAMATMTLDGVTGPINLSAETKRSNWGNTISGKSVSESTNRMYATVHFPAQPDMAGKTAQLQMRVQARYPDEVAGGFVDAAAGFDHTAKVEFSAAGAGTTYKSAWWMGQAAAVVLSVAAFGSFAVACSSLRKRANPTVVTPADAAPDTP